MATPADTMVLGSGRNMSADRDTAEAQAPAPPASLDTAERDSVRAVGAAVQAWPEWTEDEGFDEPETYDNYGDPFDDMADAAGIKRYGEI